MVPLAPVSFLSFTMPECDVSNSQNGVHAKLEKFTTAILHIHSSKTVHDLHMDAFNILAMEERVRCDVVIHKHLMHRMYNITIILYIYMMYMMYMCIYVYI